MNLEQSAFKTRIGCSLARHTEVYRAYQKYWIELSKDKKVSDRIAGYIDRVIWPTMWWTGGLFFTLTLSPWCETIEYDSEKKGYVFNQQKGNEIGRQIEQIGFPLAFRIRTKG